MDTIRPVLLPLLHRITNLRMLLCLSILITGCAPVRLYSGPRLPEDQVAVISMPIAGAQVTKVDGQPLKLNSYKFEILPGAHSITIYYSISHVGHALFEGEDTLTFHAEAGHEYRVDASIVGDGKMAGWIRDGKFGKVVAGQDPWAEYRTAR